jgi:hypothetical protein
MEERKYDRYGITVQRPHLVLLGAGASRAAFPKGEKNGLIPPLMNDFFDIVEDLSGYLEKHGIEYKKKNFEEVYSSMYENSKYAEIRTGVEGIVYNYFARMDLPDEPTLYDHLVLSLTGRDVIATFNWDPFLWQAGCRNCNRVGKDNTPHLLFLHSNTEIGFCAKHNPSYVGYKRINCKRCGSKLETSRLLYPIAEKDYTNDPYIKNSWDIVKDVLSCAYMFTIFGYGAPSSDKKAFLLLQQGWGNLEQRNLEEIEMVDIVDENTLCTRWKTFIHSHHYHTYNDFYSSLIGVCSRRSADVRFNEVINIIYREEYPIPKNASWDELNEWLKPYIEVENKAIKRA